MNTIAPARIGRYEVVCELGRGPVSAMYRANDPEIERIVAIKVYDPRICEKVRDGSTSHILQRVQAASTLSHRNILRIFDVGEEEQTGAPFVVSEAAPGKSLEQWIAQGEKFTEERAIAIARELLDALSYAHSHGVPHLDLKPSNIFVTPDGGAKIADFGALQLSQGSTFVAPEQLQGFGDSRSDLFSIGVILYLLLSGHRPFQGSSDATISFKLIHQHPVPVAAFNFELSSEVDQFIARLLAKDPDERYQTADEADSELENIENGTRFVTTSLPAGLRNSKPHASRTRSYSLVSGSQRLKVGIVSATVVLIFVFAVIGKSLLAVPSPPAVALHIPVPTHDLARPASRINTPTPSKARSTPKSYSPPAETVAVPVEVQHPFSQFELTIWIDDHLAYSNAVRGERKKRFLHLGSSSTPYLSVLQANVGKHVVRVRVTSSVGFDQTATVAGLFSRPGGQKLQINCNAPDKLQAILN